MNAARIAELEARIEQEERRHAGVLADLRAQLSAAHRAATAEERRAARDAEIDALPEAERATLWLAGCPRVSVATARELVAQHGAEGLWRLAAEDTWVVLRGRIHGGVSGALSRARYLSPDAPWNAPFADWRRR